MPPDTSTLFYFIIAEDLEELDKKAKELNFTSFFEIINIIGWGLITNNRIIIDLLQNLNTLKQNSKP